MLTIRTSKEQDEMLTYLRKHKVRFTPKLKELITRELKEMCIDFKMKEPRIKNAPDWLYN